MALCNFTSAVAARYFRAEKMAALKYELSNAPKPQQNKYTSGSL
jgi:hypothetical protein